MNTVGPYHNRQETYNYFSLPFCRGTRKELSHYHETLGENILGIELEYSGVEINFKRKIPFLSFLLNNFIVVFQVIKPKRNSVK